MHETALRQPALSRAKALRVAPEASPPARPEGGRPCVSLRTVRCLAPLIASTGDQVAAWPALILASGRLYVPPTSGPTLGRIGASSGRCRRSGAWIRATT